MFVLIYFLVVAIAQYTTNRLLSISDENEDSYTFEKLDGAVLAILLLVGIILQIIVPKVRVLDESFWIIAAIYAFSVLISMIIFSTVKKSKIEKQREEIKQVYDILQRMVDKKNQGLDFNNVPFTLGYKYGNINKIDVVVEPTTFDEKQLSTLILQLNNFLPTFTWNYELHLEERYMTFIGEDKPPEVARWHGSWLRPAKMFPAGVSGKGELIWQPDSISKSLQGRSLFTDNEGNPLPADLSLSKAPQGLIAGGPLSLNTIIPTTVGYKTMGTIDVGDFVFDLFGNKTRVLGVYDTHKAENMHRLTFRARNGYTETVESDDIHRFPVLNGTQFDLVTCSQLKVGDIVIGNNSNFTLVSKESIESADVRCITTACEEHVFLITSAKHEDWKDYTSYPFSGIYTANTGGGKAIWIEQEID